ncbi:hypothetical protein [Nocardia sp. NPDC050406]|uniref:hypothetical protein n=1 Tax=Nocardia sp. NPDC050406 TaxID=3364318 RepID=UPI0037941394
MARARVQPVVENETVQVVSFDPSGEVRILSSPVDVDDFTVSPVHRIDVRDKRPSGIELLVRGGGTSWLSVAMAPKSGGDTTVFAGARLVNGEWTSWTPLCLDSGMPSLTAASETELFGICEPVRAVRFDSAEYHLFSSSDGGLSFTDLGLVGPTGADRQPVVAVTGSTLVVAVSESESESGMILRTSRDGGRTWTTTHDPAPAANSDASFPQLEFVTDTWGFALEAHYGGRGFDEDGELVAIPYTGRLLTTADAGASWATVEFD